MVPVAMIPTQVAPMPGAEPKGAVAGEQRGRVAMQQRAKARVPSNSVERASLRKQGLVMFSNVTPPNGHVVRGSASMQRVVMPGAGHFDEPNGARPGARQPVGMAHAGSLNVPPGSTAPAKPAAQSQDRGGNAGSLAVPAGSFIAPAKPAAQPQEPVGTPEREEARAQASWLSGLNAACRDTSNLELPVSAPGSAQVEDPECETIRDIRVVRERIQRAMDTKNQVAMDASAVEGDSRDASRLCATVATIAPFAEAPSPLPAPAYDADVAGLLCRHREEFHAEIGQLRAMVLEDCRMELKEARARINAEQAGFCDALLDKVRRTSLEALTEVRNQEALGVDGKLAALRGELLAEVQAAPGAGAGSGVCDAQLEQALQRCDTLATQMLAERDARNEALQDLKTMLHRLTQAEKENREMRLREHGEFRSELDAVNQAVAQLRSGGVGGSHGVTGEVWIYSEMELKGRMADLIAAMQDDAKDREVALEESLRRDFSRDVAAVQDASRQREDAVEDALRQGFALLQDSAQQREAGLEGALRQEIDTMRDDVRQTMLNMEEVLRQDMVEMQERTLEHGIHHSRVGVEEAVRHDTATACIADSVRVLEEALRQDMAAMQDSVQQQEQDVSTLKEAVDVMAGAVSQIQTKRQDTAQGAQLSAEVQQQLDECSRQVQDSLRESARSCATGDLLMEQLRAEVRQALEDCRNDVQETTSSVCSEMLERHRSDVRGAVDECRRDVQEIAHSRQQESMELQEGMTVTAIALKEMQDKLASVVESVEVSVQRSADAPATKGEDVERLQEEHARLNGDLAILRDEVQGSLGRLEHHNVLLHDVQDKLATVERGADAPVAKGADIERLQEEHARLGEDVTILRDEVQGSLGRLEHHNVLLHDVQDKLATVERGADAPAAKSADVERLQQEHARLGEDFTMLRDEMQGSLGLLEHHNALLGGLKDEVASIKALAETSATATQGQSNEEVDTREALEAIMEKRLGSLTVNIHRDLAVAEMKFETQVGEMKQELQQQGAEISGSLQELGELVLGELAEVRTNCEEQIKSLGMEISMEAEARGADNTRFMEIIAAGQSQAKAPLMGGGPHSPPPMRTSLGTSPIPSAAGTLLQLAPNNGTPNKAEVRPAA